MYCLKVEHSFDSAHFLGGYEGKCGNIHGHRWKVEVEIKSEELKRTGQFSGMLVDFSDLKKDVKEIVDYFDHALIIENKSMRKETLNCLREDNFRIIEVDFRPTAENFAKYFFKYIEGKGYMVSKVVVYETPNNCAIYTEN